MMFRKVFSWSPSGRPPLILLQILLESPEEFEAGKSSPFPVEVLTCMDDPALCIDPMMGELKGDPLVGGMPRLKGMATWVVSKSMS